MANELTNTATAYASVPSYETMTVPVQQDPITRERWYIDPRDGRKCVVPPETGNAIKFAIPRETIVDRFTHFAKEKPKMSFQTGSRKVVEGHIGTVQFDGVEVYETSQTFDNSTDASDAAQRTLTAAVAKLLNPAS